MIKESLISHSKGGTTITGTDGIKLYQAIVLKHGLGLLMHGIRPHRGWTKTKALKWIGEYTGQTYKLTECERAVADIKVWIELMRSAIPHEVRE